MNAFYFGVKDTLVAKDLDHATRVAYQVKTNKSRIIQTFIDFHF